MVARHLSAVSILAALITTLALAQARQPRSFTCTATAYSVHGETADGDITKPGQTVAADPAFIPLGSRIKVTGAGRYSGIYTVTDTGRKIDGREIDIFIPDPAAAKEFGRKTVRVTILKLGDEKKGEKESKRGP